jgi:transposase-like protein
METKTKNSSTTLSNRKLKTPGAAPPNYSAQQKAQAVLSVWTERASASEVCRQMHVSWITVQQWQERAMEGMLQALEPRVNLAKGAALSPRLQALLAKRHKPAQVKKLAERLEQIQLAKAPETPAQNP